MINEESLLFMIEKHRNQTRKNGTPYFWHPLSVAIQVKEMGYDDDYILTALFHDLLEDTNTTEEEILKYSNENVLKAVKLLTKSPENDGDYLLNIHNNPVATIVKIEDRIDNLKEAATSSDVDFIDKYIADTVQYIDEFDEPRLMNAYIQLKSHRMRLDK